MTPYRVEWGEDAEEDLARLWLTLAEPNHLTIAQAEADRLLSRDPFGFGQHVSEGLYRLQVSSLILIFSIDQASCLVEVCALGWVG